MTSIIIPTPSAKSRQTKRDTKQQQKKSVSITYEKSGDERWDVLLASPASDVFLKQLSEQTRQDFLNGETEPGGFDGEVENHEVENDEVEA
jgi:hypothetical protein